MLDFSITDRHLPFKMTTSFMMTAAVVTLPLQTFQLIDMVIQDPTFRGLLKLPVLVGTLFFGSEYLADKLDQGLETVKKKMTPRPKSDAQNFTLPTLFAMAGAHSANSLITSYLAGSVLPKGASFFPAAPIVTAGLAMLLSCSTGITHGTIGTLLRQNNWRPPQRRRRPKGPPR